MPSRISTLAPLKSRKKSGKPLACTCTSGFSLADFAHDCHTFHRNGFIIQRLSVLSSGNSLCPACCRALRSSVCVARGHRDRHRQDRVRVLRPYPRRTIQSRLHRIRCDGPRALSRQLHRRLGDRAHVLRRRGARSLRVRTSRVRSFQAWRHDPKDLPRQNRSDLPRGSHPERARRRRDPDQAPRDRASRWDDTDARGCRA